MTMGIPLDDVFSMSSNCNDVPTISSCDTNFMVGKKECAYGNAELDDFFAIFDQLWGVLLNLARRLRDVMRMYNEKKQMLGWELDVNALSTSLNSINLSFSASCAKSFGSLLNGCFKLYGDNCPDNAVEAVEGVGDVEIGEAGKKWNTMGTMAEGSLSIASAYLSRIAETERAMAEFKNKNAQSYNRNLDEILQKAIEIMQQMMDMGRKMVEVFSQTLHAFAK